LPARFSFIEKILLNLFIEAIKLIENIATFPNPQTHSPSQKKYYFYATMLFENIIGLETTKQHLAQLVQQDRIPHAIMINGQKGSGGLPLAVAFAQYILCTNRSATDSCGGCSNCAKLSKLQHVDVHYSFPTITVKDKDPLSVNFIAQFRSALLDNPYLDITAWQTIMDAGTKQANISAKECRSIFSKLQMRSFEGGFKFLIMWLPEFLGKEGNILLKLIEEPPPNTIFIFVTEHYEEVLGTIQSRTQLVQMQPITDAQICTALVARGISEKNAMQIARIAEGNVTMALQSATHTEEEHFISFRNWLNVLFTNNGIGIIEWVIMMAEKPKETQKQYLNYVVTMMEHLVRSKWIDKNHLLLETEEAGLIDKLLAKNINEEKANAIAHYAAQDIYAIERNANTKILFQVLSMQVKDIFAGKSLYL
jgi:DNA polymerase III subunit delta'